MTAAPSSAVAATPGTVAATTPYPWPYEGVLEPSRWCLVVAGHDATWAGRCADAERVAATIDALAEGLRAHGVAIVRVVHRPHGSDPGAPPGRLGEDPGALVVTASGTDGFFGSGLDHLLRATGRDHLLLAGFGLEGPVHSTMRSANDRGDECLLVLDACAALDAGLAAAARSMVEMSGGIFGAVGATADVLAALATVPTTTDPTEGSP